MKLVEIFQQRNPDYLLTMKGKPMPITDMVKVAEFDSDMPTVDQALEEAFSLTNTWDRMDRLRMVPVEHRSTSIGDVVRVDGEAFQCARDGWTPVPEFKP